MGLCPQPTGLVQSILSFILGGLWRKRARAAKAREQCGLALGDTKNSQMGAGLGGLAPRDTNGAERAGRRRRRERVWRGSVVMVSSIRDLCPGRPCSRPLRSRSPEGHVGACAVVIDRGFTVRVWFMHRWLEAECQSPSARRSSQWLPCLLFSQSWGSPVRGPELHAL